MERFTLVGVDGNAYSLMGYTAICLRRAGLADKIDQMWAEATAKDYNNLVCVCAGYVEMANDAIDQKGGF